MATWPFFTLTCAVSWALWIPLMWWLNANGRLGGAEGGLEGLPTWIAALWFLGSWAPSLVGIGLTARAGGRTAGGRLLRRALAWRVGARWHLVTWLGPAAVGLVALGVYVARGGGAPDLDPARWPLIPVALVLALPFGPLGEEFGWRGYALPRLLRSRSAAASAVIVGLVWTVWHLPLFWAPAGTSISGAPVTPAAIAIYTVEIVSLSILITWLFIETGGSLLIAIGAHTAWNAGMERFLFAPLGDEAAQALAAWSTVLLAAAAMVVILAWTRQESRESVSPRCPPGRFDARTQAGEEPPARPRGRHISYFSRR